MSNITLPRPRNAERTRAAILDAAESSFAGMGFDGARIDEMATSAGVNKALLYHYFRDKQRLYVAVLERLMKRVAERMRLEASRFSYAGPIEALRGLMSAYFELMWDEPRYAKLFVREAASGWKTIQAIEEAMAARLMGAESVDETLGVLLPVLERGAKAGELRSDLDFTLVIALASSFCRFYLLLIPRLQLLYTEPLASREKMAWARDQIVELLLYGIAAKTRT